MSVVPVYYNDHDPFAVQWLRNLIDARMIPAGEVDPRPMEDVRGADLWRYDQCHFFAGIAGWPAALLMAGWEGPVWTGSCPCQPFSSAGRRGGANDPRDLWPEFRRLIAECRPPTCFGEQVGSPDGRRWLDGVRDDLEQLGYAVGAADLPAASVAAPHIRQRLWWVADASCYRWEQGAEDPRARQPEPSGHSPGLADPVGKRRRAGRHSAPEPTTGPVLPAGPGEGMGDSDSTRFQGGERAGAYGPFERDPWETAIPTGGSLDGETRRVIFRLQRVVDGISGVVADGSPEGVNEAAPGYQWDVLSPVSPPGEPARVGKLRGYGNAIVPQLGAEFIRAFMECRP